VLLLGLSAGHKLGLALVAAAFAGFSLIVSMVVPRWRPQFPGRGLPLFLVVCAALFVGMLAAVEIFGKESESEAAGKGGGKRGGTAVKVSEVDYKIKLPEMTLKAGSYQFEVSNDAKVPHNLTVKGPGAGGATSDIAPGKGATLAVDLKPGSYDFFCSVPGHKQLGMDLKVKVT
jgi:plastocyanin